MRYPPATIPLSEAILLGSAKSPQGFSSWRDVRGGRCVLGTALDTLGLLDEVMGSSENPYDALTELWPILRTRLHNDPSAEMLLFVLIALNDSNRWSRPQIAAYVKQIEERQARDMVTQRAVTSMASSVAE